MTFKDRIVKSSRRFRSKQKQKQKKLLRPCHKKRSNLEMTQISTFDVRKPKAVKKSLSHRRFRKDAVGTNFVSCRWQIFFR